MDQNSGSNKVNFENLGDGKVNQGQNNLPYGHFNEFAKENLSGNNTGTEDTSKYKSYNEDGEGGSERDINNKTQVIFTPVSSPTSSTQNCNTQHNELNHGSQDYSMSSEEFDKNSSNRNYEWKNISPSHVLISPPLENGENKPSMRPSLSPSPNLSSFRKIIPVSGESSDEKGDKSKICSREGSFERSVSFVEGALEPEKSHESLRASDSNRSIDSSRAIESSAAHSHASSGREKDRDRKESRESKSGEKDKKSKKAAWYSVLNPTYKSRSEELKKLFKDLPPDERLIVDYSCALQKDILVHGRLYVTSNYFSFYSKIFGWETLLSIKCKDIVTLTKEKTALVIPNALQINTDTDKHFFTSFAARDKTYLMLFRIWQNALMDQLPLSNLARMRRMYSNPNSPQMSAVELWQWVHSSYGEELGLTSDDDDYVAPSTEDDMKGSVEHVPSDPSHDVIVKMCKRNSVDSAEDISQGDSIYEDGQSTIRMSNAYNEVQPLKIPSKKSSPTRNLPPLESQVPVHPPIPSPVGNENEIPTDDSDSVDSDPEKEKLLGPFPDTVICPNIGSHHIGREVASVIYELPIDTLFTLLFTNSKFMFDLYEGRKTYDVVISPWQSNPETNQKIRQVTYTLTLPTNSFGPKVSHVTETQVISSFSKPSEIYTIDAEASNSGIPYADSFFVSNHWCLTRESAGSARLTLWSQVKYKKSVWGFMKNVIDKNAFSGIDNFMKDLNTSLLHEVDRSNLKRTKRRRRRAGSKGNDVGDPLHVPSPIAVSSEIHKCTQIPSRKMTLPSVSPEPSGPPVRPSSKSATIFLCALLILNAFLYYRLYDLEGRVLSNASSRNLGIFDSSVIKFSSGQGDESLAEEWVQILRHQESLHAEELERWQEAVMEAAEYLKKAEVSLRNLQASIPTRQASKMQSLLNQLKLLQQIQEKKESEVPARSPSRRSSPQQDAEGQYRSFSREKSGPLRKISRFLRTN